MITIADSWCDLNDSSSTDVWFLFIDKYLLNFKRKNNLLMSLKVRETTRRIQSVVKWVPHLARTVYFLNSQVITTVCLRCLFLDAKILFTRGYQKVRRLMQWNQYFLSYAYRFVGNLKQQMFYQLWKYKLETLIINHFIIKYIYMVWSPCAVSVEYRDIPQRHCFPVLLSIF